MSYALKVVAAEEVQAEYLPPHDSQDSHAPKHDDQHDWGLLEKIKDHVKNKWQHGSDKG